MHSPQGTQTIDCDRRLLLCILKALLPRFAAHFAAMAVTSACAIMALPTVAPSKLERTSFAGSGVQGLPSVRTVSKERSVLRVEASSNRNRKINTKEPFGPSGGTKFAKGVDASGRVAKGKGVYQFAKKYGANVDGYSPIYDTGEWSKSGDIYAGGQSGLALWAALLGALLIGGAILVYNTSALVPY